MKRAPRTARRQVGQHHGDLRRALLDVALARLEDADGGAELSLRALAREAGVSPGAPYHHFGSMEGLVAALATDGFERLTRVIDDAAHAAGPSPRARLEAMGAAYVRFALRRPAHYRLMWKPALGTGEHAALDASALACFQRLVGATRAAAPALEDNEVLRRAALSWSLAHGYVTLSLDGVLSRPGPKGSPAGLDLTADVGRAVASIALGA